MPPKTGEEVREESGALYRRNPRGCEKLWTKIGDGSLPTEKELPPVGAEGGLFEHPPSPGGGVERPTGWEGMWMARSSEGFN